MKKIRLNEADLRYMIRKAVNEVLAYEGQDDAQSKGRNYYFGSGDDPTYGGNNKLSGEGGVGENFEEFLSVIQEYTAKKMEEFAGRKGIAQRELDSWLKACQRYHGMYSKQTQRKHEAQVRRDNEYHGTKYPEYLKPGGGDYYMHDRLTKDIENEDEDNKRWLERELRIVVEMPTGEKNPNNYWTQGGWRRFANESPEAKVVKIDPENVEESAKEAFSLFTEYAKRTPEVVGWYLWSWSTFGPTMKPILTPEVGKEISDEGDKIAAYYSGPSGSWTGD